MLASGKVVCSGLVPRSLICRCRAAIISRGTYYYSSAPTNQGTRIKQLDQSQASVEEQMLDSGQAVHLELVPHSLICRCRAVRMGFFDAHPMLGMVFVAHPVLSKLACYALYGGT